MGSPIEWEPIDTAPEGVVVRTKIDDAHGVRNERTLKRRGRLWLVPDGSVYVYYTPTHWAHIPAAEPAKEERHG